MVWEEKDKVGEKSLMSGHSWCETQLCCELITKDKIYPL